MKWNELEKTIQMGNWKCSTLWIKLNVAGFLCAFDQAKTK